MNFPGISSQDIIGGMKEEQNIVDSLGKKQESPSFSPTLTLGLVTEIDCFKAIKELGDAKFYLKDVISKLALKTDSSRADLDKASKALQQVHANQLIIVNDVCRRFGVIHPELKNPTKEMLEHKTLYWDWYADQHKKVYGTRPEILGEKPKPPLE